MAEADTERRIKQMVAFIRQEARDKAEEIEVRAKEECNVEVMKMTDREKAKMREEFKQREKRIEIENKITKQKVLDGYRMELLKAEDSKKTELKEMAQKRFAGVVKDSGKYKEFLKQAMIQAFLLIWDEDEVTVSCRKQDQSVVKNLMQGALDEVKSRAQKECNTELKMNATFNNKPVKCSGGVLVSARGGKVVCDNTLDARLNIVMRTELPMVRERLFGKGRLTTED
jgi:V-type H+-transporting ATPase subunit E